MPSRTEQTGLRRAIHFVPSAPFGGIQTLVPGIAAQQAAAGRAVELAIFGQSRQLRQFLADEGIDVPIRQHSGLIAPLSLMWQLLSARDAIWHSHCEPFWATLLMAASFPRRWIVHLHDYPNRFDKRSTRVALAVQKRIAQRWIAISRSIASAWERAEKFPKTQIDTVWNGVRLADQPPVRERRARFSVGFVGRVVEMKGIFDFIRLASAMRQEPDFEFHVYGEGPELKAAQSLASNLGVTENIVFHGFVSDMATAWASLDAMAMFSSREPFGLVVLEAVAHGVGAIVFDNESGALEVAGELRSTKCVAVGDIAAAAEAVREWRSDPHLAEILLEDRETIRSKFDLRRVVREIDASYGRIDQSSQPNG